MKGSGVITCGDIRGGEEDKGTEDVIDSLKSKAEEGSELSRSRPYLQDQLGMPRGLTLPRLLPIPDR